jgi:signal transduction histidine kinase
MENKLSRIAQFRQAAENQMDDIRRQLLHMLSQELRSPLTYIFGGAEMLEEYLGDLPDDTAHDMLHLVQTGVKRLNRLVNNILYLVTIDSGHLKRIIEQYGTAHDMREIVNSAVRAIQANPQFTHSELQVEVISPETPLYVHGVDEYLVMMVAEILHNAFKFSPQRAKVTVEMRQVGQELRITIQDQGPGIAPEKLDTVWERFMQMHHEDYEQQGSGLGLSLVRESARLHGGDCTISSEQGVGTSVTLQLPLVETGPD